MQPRDLLEKSIFEALRNYSNVHRGSGHKSITSTLLFEHSRKIVLEYLGLSPSSYSVIFCSPHQAVLFERLLSKEDYRIVSSGTLGLSLGIRAVAVKKTALPGGPPPQSGGGNAKLISRDWVIWTRAPGKFEAGTPAVINIIALARALQLEMKYGVQVSQGPDGRDTSSAGLLTSGFMDGYRGNELLEALRNARIGLDLKVPTVQGERPFINFDNSASTPTFLPVWDTFRHFMYSEETDGDNLIETVQKIYFEFLGASGKDKEVLFTSNTTESINLVAGSLGKDLPEDFEPVVACTILEHSSDDLPWRMIPNHTLVRIPVDLEGFIDLQILEEMLEAYNASGRHGKKRVRLVAVSAASNVLGTCNDLKAISDLAHRYGAELLVDGAQLVAHRKVEMDQKGIDYFVFSAHKVYAPFGCGILVVRKGLLRYTPREMETIRVCGQENRAGIAALGKIFYILGQIGMDVIEQEEQELTAFVLTGIGSIPGIKMMGIRDVHDEKHAQRVGVIPFNLKDTISFRVGKELAVYNGIGLRVGCHCAHILVKYLLGVSPGLEKFQRIMQTLIPSVRFPGLVRISLGMENTREEVEVLLDGLKQVSERKTSGHSKYPGKEMDRILADYSMECRRRVFSTL